MRLYSIGHSNHSLEIFLGLLRQEDVHVLVDVRSSPYSRFAPHFNREELKPQLRSAGIQYLFMGDLLGGRPDGDEFYDAAGHVLYDEVAATSWFQEGIQRLSRGAASHRVAMMCSEEDPTDCHRRLLVARVLGEHGFEVLHIRRDGSVVTETGLGSDAAEVQQESLFDAPQTPSTLPWRSTRSVSRRSPPQTSSIS